MTAPVPPSSPARSTRIALAALALLGLALLGVAVWVATRPVTFGWFAYAPLSETTYVPGGAFPPGTAALFAGAGALLLGGVAGYVVGRRGRAHPPLPPKPSSLPSGSR
ncbi:hypothetical protein ACO229_11220 [Promicromonospora sp. MS192]|uniref:hypothetical protein n=1 Tax=Promicromonospora sp. MS192 TaxID=3412684 RepID=UPI003C2FC8CE